MSPASVDDGNNYYEQYNIVGNGVIKTGDYVYVATDNGKQSIAQVQTIWDTKEWVKLPKTLYDEIKKDFNFFLLFMEFF